MNNCSLRLYETLARELKDVVPADGKTLKFYCCGPTVYGPAHIGNFRTFVVQDLFRRVVELSGTKTKHVRNITDVDDKTIAGAQAAGMTLSDFTAIHRENFHRDCKKLNVLSPHVEPSAVEHISEQIEMISRLEQKGLAYAAKDGSVYFKVSAFENYGSLSRLKEREISSSEESAVVADEYDREAAVDFALWKARKVEDGDNYWSSPWGEGRPGWHLECSAMCLKHLGESFDLHSGGVDLIFPHHENEIAQSEGVTGKTFAGHWFHITHLMVEGQKMSKSLGNLYTLNDIEERGFCGADLRYVLLMAHYRKQLNFTWDSLSAAASNRKRLGLVVAKLSDIAGLEICSPEYETIFSERSKVSLGRFQPVWDSLLSDLNTAQALGKLYTAVKELELATELNQESALGELEALNFVLAAYGFEADFSAASKTAITPPHIEELAQKRWEAKQAKNWAVADALREEILNEGWEVKDSSDGYTLLPKD